MKIEIKSWIDAKVLFSLETDSVKLALEAAVREGAYLKGAYLTGADLKGADLTGADLKGADLTGAYLKGADLTGAYLTGADLKGADLTGADLTGAYLKGAYLKGADLKGADLTGAYLTGADLKGADLTGADLTGAYLKGAYLKGAYLKGADLKGADLKPDTKLPTGETWQEYLDVVLPELVKAGGGEITKEALSCHTWTNCPMAQAFKVHDLKDVPVLLRPRVEQFVEFFDSKLIPEASLKKLCKAASA